MARLSSADIKLAKSREFLDDYLDRRRSPTELLEHCLAELDEMGYRLVKKKGSSNWKRKRLTTTLRRKIYLGVTWDKKTVAQQAALLAHELVHARQHRGLARFIWRYLADSTFRWAVEAQAYRETVRAWRAMGRDAETLRGISKSVTSSILKRGSYFILGRKLRRQIKSKTPAIVLAA